MPWTTHHTPSRLSLTRHIAPLLIALLALLTLLLLCVTFPLLILLSPAPETSNAFPPGIMCATCADINEHNPLLLAYINGGTDMGCLARESSDLKGEKTVLLSGMKRCWAREKDLDEWLRPVGWTREDMVKAKQYGAGIKGS